MNTAITATRTRVLTVCVLCAADVPHTRCDTALPVAQRTTIAVPVRPQPQPDPLIPGYGTSLAGYPAI